MNLDWVAAFATPDGVAALATAALVLPTFATVWITYRFLKEQNNQSKIAKNTEFFLQLRERAISSTNAARRHRIVALLMYLRRLKIQTDQLDFSPDITLFLNDYQWISRLVEDDLL